MPRHVASHDDDRGIAMVTVLVLAGLLFGMAVLFATRGIADLDQATEARAREGALHVGESGVDDLLARLVADRTYNTGDTIAASCEASISAERACVKGIADSAPAARVVKAVGGEWVAIKPAGTPVAYAVGYVPTRAAPLRVRVVRVRYDFAPLNPQTALLTDGDLTLQGSTALQGVLGSSHANGATSIVGGSFVADGFIASSGTLSGSTAGVDDCQPPPAGTSCANTSGGQPKRTIPTVSPRDLYRYSEFDLCLAGSGEVRAGPSHDTLPNLGPNGTPRDGDEVPCAGALLVAFGGGLSTYNGWERQAGSWRYGSSTAYNGSYYVYQSSARITGSPGSTASPWEATVIADCGTTESVAHTAHGDCDIELQGAPQMRPSVKGYPFLFVSGRDVRMRGTGNTNDPSRLEGAILAHEQFSLGGNTDYLGAVVSNSRLHTAGSPVSANELFGNARVTFDGNLELPFGTTIRITHWQEL